jgi:predicted amino acid dehydrogenase
MSQELIYREALKKEQDALQKRTEEEANMTITKLNTELTRKSNII